MLGYFDNAATMEPEQEMLERYAELCKQYWWNPSSVSESSIKTRQAIEDVRKRILKYINGREGDKIIFTSGGTEANNLAIKGFCYEKYTHFLTKYDKDGYYDRQYRVTPSVFASSVEHPSVLNPINWLYDMEIIDNYNIVNCNDDGTVNKKSLKERISYIQDIKFHPIFASIMMANNELGSVNNIKTISEIVHKYNGILHVDAVQAFTHMKIDVQEMGIDMMSVSGHKFGAPHGIGFLYVKEGIDIEPLLHGGGQEKGLRSGTEDAPSIIMMGEIIDRVYHNFDNDIHNVEYCSKDLRKCLQKDYNVKINSPVDGLPNIINVTINGVDNEQLITNLDYFGGVQVSAGSACHAGIKKPSKVLKEIGLTKKEINNTIRISLNRNVTIDEIFEFLRILRNEIERLIRL
jgi:cysteine desulfurase